MCSGVDEVERFRQLYSVFRLVGVCAVVTVCVNLVIYAVSPVIVCHVAVLRIHVTFHEEVSPLVPHRIPAVPVAVRIGAVFSRAYAYASQSVCHRLVRSSWSWLVVVVYDIHVHALAAVAAIARPVVEYVVTHIHVLILLSSLAWTKSWHTADVVSHKVMMERSVVAAPVATISVGTLGMTGIDQ